MKKVILTVTVTTIILLFTQSCGSIIHGTTQEIGFSSSPSNATVSINGQNYGNTPLIADLKRKNTHIVKFELSGYQPYETTITRSTSGWVWGNIVFGGLIGLVVDASTGGMYKLSHEQVSAEMRGSSASNLVSKDGLFIAVVLETDPEWEKVGSLEKVE